jgi:DnaJ family protein C protein 19
MKFLLFIALVFVLYVIAKRAFATGGGMNIADAAKLLDVAPDADPAQIMEAHKRLIAKVHPDAGGTSQLAAQVNQARDILLRNISSR